MSVRLGVFNPSPHWRQGFVTTHWQPIFDETGIPPKKIVVRDSAGKRLRAQVDEIDPEDPWRATLVFSLDQKVAPGPQDYSTPSDYVFVDQDDSAEPQKLGPQLEITEPAGQERTLHLSNERLRIQFHLVPAPGGDDRRYFSGAASSVQLYDGLWHKYIEVLDNFRAAQSPYLDHDPEKRCMQIDQVRLPSPAWDYLPYQQFDLIGRSYQLISQSSGSVRASVTIASQPFDYVYYDPASQEERLLACRLYRVLNLYNENICLDEQGHYVYDKAGSIIEELFVKGLPKHGKPDTKAVHLYFTARYFMYMDLGLTIEDRINQFTRIRDWFVLAYEGDPFQSFGFATSAHADLVANPHPGFLPANKHKSFSWSLGPSRETQCVHLFMRGSLQEIVSRTGRAWSDYLYKPLKAKISI